MAINFPASPTTPDLNQPDTYNARVLAAFTWCFTTMPEYLEGLDAADFFSVLGTVSQSGGVPTGALFERGSNGNGEYVRFAVGTQICWGKVTTSSGAGVALTFPAAFLNTSKLKVTTGVNASAAILIAASFTGITTTGLTASTFDSSNARIATQVEYTAIGRWF